MPLIAVGVLGTAGVIGLAVIAAGVGGAWSYRNSGDATIATPPELPATALSPTGAHDAWEPLLAGAKYDPATEQAVIGFIATYGTATPPPPEVALAESWLDQYDAWRTLAIPTAVEKEYDVGGLVYHLAANATGTKVAVTGPDQRVGVLDLATGTVDKLGVVDAAPTAIAWNPLGGGVAVASGSTVQYFAVGSADSRPAMTAHTSPVASLTFAIDGTLYSGGSSVIAEWPKGDVNYTQGMPDGDTAVRVAVMPDGKVGAIGTKGMLRVWKTAPDGRGGERIGDTALSVVPSVVAYVDPDLIIGAAGKLVAVDAASGGIAWTWTTDGTVISVSASPSGWIAVGTDRGAVVILDGTTHAELGRWLAPNGNEVELTAIGDRIAVVASDSKVRVLAADPAKLKDFPPPTTIGSIPGPAVAAAEAPKAPVAVDVKPKMKPEFATVVGTYDVYVDRTNDQCSVPGLQFGYDAVRIDGSGIATATGSGAKRSFKAKVEGPVVSWSDTHDYPDGGCDGGKARTSWRLIKRPDAEDMGGTVAESIDVLVGGSACVTCDIVTTVRLVPR